MYSFGVHSEAQLSSNAPLWLAELRRRCFVKCYHIDGVISRNLSRPQRLLRRFSDCALPLDLSDDELLALGTNSDRTGADLSDRNVYPAWHSASWARLTYLVDTMNEELLDYVPVPSSADSYRRLSWVPVLSYTVSAFETDSLEQREYPEIPRKMGRTARSSSIRTIVLDIAEHLYTRL